MASLEATFRKMRGEEPIEKEKVNETITETNKVVGGTMLGINIDGKPEGATTKDFMDCVKNTLIEARGGTVPESSSPVPQNVKSRQNRLVENGKVLVALMNAIKEERLDTRVLSNMESDIHQLTEHLSAYPEFRTIIQKKIKKG
jgi:hypothetical protein